MNKLLLSVYWFVWLQAKYLAQIVVTGAQIIGRAFVKALQSEVRASQQAAQARSSNGSNVKTAAADSLTGITLQVLRVKSSCDQKFYHL